MKASDLLSAYRSLLNPPYQLKDFVAIFLTVLLLLLAPLTIIGSWGERPVTVSRADIGGLIALINQHRAANGVPPLADDQNLVNSACWFANDMATYNYFRHEPDSLGRSWIDRFAAFGIGGSFWRGENLVAGASNASDAFNLWNNSPGHNANMLRPEFTRIGVGNAYNAASDYDWYWVTEFASGPATAVTNQCNASPPPATGNILGRIWKDDNGNGIYDLGERIIQNGVSCGTAASYSLGGVSINYSGPVSGSGVPNLCNPDPYYDTGPVPVGTYTVSVSLPTGWVPTTSNPITVGLGPGVSEHRWFGIKLSDTTPPSVSIISPTNGSTVAGTVTITAQASDNVGVRDVKFYIDGTLRRTDSSPPYSYNWNTRTLGDTSHNLFAAATDTSNNTRVSTLISVSVKQDIDGDGFSYSLEEYVGTDPIDNCANTIAANDEANDRWPADFDDNKRLDIDDINSFVAPVYRFNTKRGHPNYSPRWDVNADGAINIGDIILVGNLTPPMFGGEKAFGKTCL